MSRNPLKGFRVDRSQIGFIGHDLQRPECILAEPDGTLWVADARGGVVRIDPDGRQTLITPRVQTQGASFEERYVEAKGSLPNGLCFDQEGNLIIANWGTNAIERMSREGRLETLYTEIDGKPLGKVNFPLRDTKGRIWFSVTTRTEPWTEQVNTKVSDGYIGLIDEKGIRIVAEGFCGTNELRFDAREEWLYVVESTAGASPGSATRTASS